MLKQLKFLPLIPHQFGKFIEGGRYFSRLLFSGVIPRYRHRVIEARGGSRLEKVVVARTDSKGRVRTGSEKTISTDALACGYGFSANIELPQLAGCELRFDPGLGGWLVAVDDEMQTTRPGVYAAGEVTAVGGAPKSITEGEMAACRILKSYDLLPEELYRRRMRILKRSRARHLRFARLFNSLYHTPKAVIEEIPDDAVICRCEDVTFGELKRVVDRGYTTPSSLKIAIRAGMGNCQGRTCGPLLYDLLSVLTGERPEEFGALTVRPPVKPTSIKSLISYFTPGEK
jgi:NAD(P)H-nitrite reductase large subunit